MAAARFDPLAYRDPSPAPWLIRLLGPVNRNVMLGPLLHLGSIDLPEADLARLKSAVNPDTAAFLGPNHPEFMTDWLIDKELSRRLSPLMAHWASYEIVNGSRLTQRFWLANNLISNAPGGTGKAYSQRWALSGNGVLLHPEGTATWQAERVGRLLPGIVEMAWDTAVAARAAGGARPSRPVFVVPVAWRLNFTRDVSEPLTREIAFLEKTLGLPRSTGPLEQRFGALLLSLLARGCERFDFPLARNLEPAAYFAVQRATIEAMRARLAGRYGELEPDITRAQHQLRKAIRTRAGADPDGARRDRALFIEWLRLHSLDPALYDVPALTQEQFAENLKRIRLALVTHGLANTLHGVLPVAVGPREVHIRAPEPLAVHEALAEGGEPGQAKSRLLAALHGRLQGAVDALGRELEPRTGRWRRANPLYSGRKC